MLILCAGSFAGGFALNTPNVLAKIPGIVTEQLPTSSPEPYIRSTNFAKVFEVEHNGLLKKIRRNLGKDADFSQISYTDSRNRTYVDDFQRYNKDTAHPITAKIESIQEDSTAKALVTVSYNERTETATVRLRKFESQWYLERFDI